MINLSAGPNHKKSWDLLCAFISDILAEIMEKRYQPFFEKNMLRDDLSEALISDRLFPDGFPKEDAAEVFLMLYALLQDKKKIYRPESPVMQYVLFHVLSRRITAMTDDYLMCRVDLPEEAKRAITDAYAADYDRRSKEHDERLNLSKADYISEHVDYYSDLGSYIELLFHEPEFLLLDKVTRDDIKRNPAFYRGYTKGTDKNTLVLSVIDYKGFCKKVLVKTERFPWVLID